MLRHPLIFAFEQLQLKDATKGIDAPQRTDSLQGINSFAHASQASCAVPPLAGDSRVVSRNLDDYATGLIVQVGRHLTARRADPRSMDRFRAGLLLEAR